MPAMSIMSLNLFGKMGFGALGGFEYVAIHAGECHNPTRAIARSVTIAAPVIALMFILGTSAVLAVMAPEQVDLIGPVPQALRMGLGNSGAVAVLVPFAILALTSRNLANSSVLFTATTRMPMVAGWDSLMPAWFTKLHPRHRTPVNSILFIGACALIFAALGMTNVGEQEAFQMLENASGVFYALTYLALFGIPLFGLRGDPTPMPWWLKGASVIGFVTVVLYVGFSVVPIVDVVSRAAFALKVGGLVVVANVVGMALYARERRRAA